MKKRIAKVIARFCDWLNRLQLKALDRQINHFTDDQIVAVIRVIAAKRDMTAYIITKNSRGQRILLIQQLLHELGLTALVGGLRMAEMMEIAIREEQRTAKRKEASLN